MSKHKSEMETVNSGRIPGYEPVLIRSAVKQSLKDYRFKQMTLSREFHIERHMITAALLTVLNDPAINEQWMRQLQNELRAEIEGIEIIKVGTPQEGNKLITTC